MKCYRVRVPTTNFIYDTFTVDGCFYPCRDGHVYVVAENMSAAVRLLPMAEEIEYVGPAYP